MKPWPGFDAGPKGPEAANQQEGALPSQPEGFYREYTVRTPGASNRGAQRLVVGRDGTVYYTNDHYRTFTDTGYRISGKP